MNSFITTNTYPTSQYNNLKGVLTITTEILNSSDNMFVKHSKSDTIFINLNNIKYIKD
jgi:hypothetical protein